ncbi:E3 ubiquitin-protein ligase TRIM8a isoform X2 [Paralichthys olivaceus]|uniref:E3 ubiquitin-protein ligase TRIM8a isoform X2 n=1 Tax=Paralichthys olivaceus TaxID=8255 RepID=UPI003752DC5A
MSSFSLLRFKLSLCWFHSPSLFFLYVFLPFLSVRCWHVQAEPTALCLSSLSLSPIHTHAEGESRAQRCAHRHDSLSLTQRPMQTTGACGKNEKAERGVVKRPRSFAPPTYKATLMRQQDRLEGRVQNIDEQLAKLEADKTLMKDTVSELKERVRAQYQRMHRLLEENQADTMQMLESTSSVYGRKQSQQVLQLNERRQEAEKLLSSVQTFLQKADNINFMKNTKPYQMLMDRSTSHLINSMPPLGLGQLNSDHLLSELSAREKNLRKMLEEPLNESAIIEIVQPRGSSAGSQMGASSTPQKRKYSMAFMGSKTENSTSQNPHTSSSHIRLLDSPAHHIMGVGSSSSHHSGTIFPSSHFPGGGASQQAMYEGRKVLMCTLNNCCCSRAPATRARPPYPPSGSFPPMTSQEFPPHATLPASQPLQHFPIGGLMVGSQAARHPDFYELYGQSSTKHYGTK